MGFIRSKASHLLNRIHTCPFIGIILATVSSFCFSLCSVIVKWLENVHPMELAAFR